MALRRPPLAYTEHEVAMLSSILNSECAIDVVSGVPHLAGSAGREIIRGSICVPLSGSRQTAFDRSLALMPYEVTQIGRAHV